MHVWLERGPSEAFEGSWPVTYWAGSAQKNGVGARDVALASGVDPLAVDRDGLLASSHRRLCLEGNLSGFEKRFEVGEDAWPAAGNGFDKLRFRAIHRVGDC